MQVAAAENKSDAVEMANKEECECQTPINQKKIKIKYEYAVSDRTNKMTRVGQESPEINRKKPQKKRKKSKKEKDSNKIQPSATT